MNLCSFFVWYCESFPDLSRSYLNWNVRNAMICRNSQLYIIYFNQKEGFVGIGIFFYWEWGILNGEWGSGLKGIGMGVVCGVSWKFIPFKSKIYII